MDFPEEIIDEFITESTEMIDAIEPEMLSASSLNNHLANSMFRPVHSLKGASASLGLNVIATTVHAAEELLTLFRSGDYESTEEAYLQFFLSFFDFIRYSFDILKDRKTDDSVANESEKIKVRAKELVTQLKGGTSVSTAPPTAKAPTPAPEKKPKIDLEPTPAPKTETKPEEDSGENSIVFVDEDMLNAFTTESMEALNNMEVHLLNLGKNPQDQGLLKECFRLMHSFKGNCGIFSLSHLEKIGHRIENLFDALANGKIPFTENIFSQLMPIIDVLRERVSKLSTTDSGKVASIDAILDLIDDLIGGKKEASAPPPSPPPAKQEEKKVEEAPPTPVQAPTPTAEVKKADQSATMSDREKKLQQRQDIRVDLAKLDQLNNLVGELVTAKNMVFEHFKELKEKEQSEKSYRFLNRITTELQDISMNIRMIPISGLFKRMIRIVHDISKKSGKKVTLVYQGEDTEIDKTVTERITDPLVHMIRNAVDHGVESPEEREKIGKPSEGKITLTARNEAGEIWILVQDDGKGLNKAAITKKAISQGLIKSENDVSESELFKFIFHPGFSTAEKITDISGRGVGMDVVMQNINNIKGRVDIATIPGKGTTFTIKIPLTLAIIQGMMLQVGNTKYTIPIENIQESVRISTDDISRPMDEQEVVKIRDHLIPVVHLSRIHHIENAITDPAEGILVIVEIQNKKLALLVDKLLGQQEIVVKPLPKYFKNIKGISGCSILGNGDTTLILDIISLLELVAVNKSTNIPNGENKNKESNELSNNG